MFELDDNFIFLFYNVDILATSLAGSRVVTRQASGGSDLTIIEVRKVGLVSWNYYLS